MQGSMNKHEDTNRKLPHIPLKFQPHPFPHYPLYVKLVHHGLLIYYTKTVLERLKCNPQTE